MRPENVIFGAHRIRIFVLSLNHYVADSKGIISAAIAKNLTAPPTVIKFVT